MKVVKNILKFCAGWLLSAALFVMIIGTLFPTDENGSLVLGEWETLITVIFIWILPIVCGIFACWVTAARYPFAKKATPKMIREAERLLPKVGYFSENYIQKALGIRFRSAAEDLALELEKRGLIKRDEYNFWDIVGSETDTEPEKASMRDIDLMEGHAFEYWCADVLRGNGFENVEVTQGSGDQGVDILATKDDIKYAIQCKCYSSDLSNKPVQEVHTGKSIYNCQIGVVMTNRDFTQGAKDAAQATGVLLWGREKVEEMAKNAGIF